MSEEGLVEPILARLEHQVLMLRETQGSRTNYSSERRDWDVLRMSTEERRNRNWRNAEVLDRQNDRRNNYRSTCGNGPHRNHGYENRNRFDRDNRGFESSNGRYQFRNRGPIDNFNRRDRRQGGRLNSLRVRVDQDDQSQNNTVQKTKLPRKLVPDHQEERGKPKGDQSGPEENDEIGSARTTRVEATGSSPNNMVAKSRSRTEERTIQPSKS
ncbi:uncharacterized protein TNCV_1133201 [Trichonephila clavipes]|nr:uncharacterized protein TNCV_1133201 [Trichonephila clavipes]